MAKQIKSSGVSLVWDQKDQSWPSHLWGIFLRSWGCRLMLVPRINGILTSSVYILLTRIHFRAIALGIEQNPKSVWYHASESIQ